MFGVSVWGDAGLGVYGLGFGAWGLGLSRVLGLRSEGFSIVSGLFLTSTRQRRVSCGSQRGVPGESQAIPGSQKVPKEGGTRAAQKRIWFFKHVDAMVEAFILKYYAV